MSFVPGARTYQMERECERVLLVLLLRGNAVREGWSGHADA
jgi:hypothetical protein